MEFVAKLSKNISGALLVIFFVLMFALPLILFLARALVDFDSSSLTPVFFELLARSFFFSLIQSFLSASLTILISLGLGTLWALQKSRAGLNLSKLAEFSGLFSFALPGVLVSLFVLQIGRHFSFFPAQGLGAIVWAHLLLNVVFVSSAFELRLRSWMAAGGSELQDAALVLGASRRWVWRVAFWPLLREEARTWFSLVFLWSFSAFSTVLILGGGPRFSSPEVLLYYSLQSDLGSSRILVLTAVQLLTGLFLGRLLLAPLTFQSSVPSRQEIPTSKNLKGFPMLLCAGLLGLLLFLAPLLAGLGGSLFSTHLSATPEILWASVNSLALALTVAFLGVFWARLLSLAESRIRKFCYSFLGISTTLLSSLILGLGIDRWSEHRPFVQFVLATAGLAAVQLPLIAFMVESRLKTIESHLLEAASLLGASHFSKMRLIAWPQISDVFARVFALGSLLALGELSLSSLFVRDFDLLPVLNYRMANRYDFSGTSWLMLDFLVLALCGYILPRWEKGFWNFAFKNS